MEVKSSFSKYELEEDELSSNILELPYGEQSILISDDFNFDGVADLAIRNRNSSCYGGPAYDIYLNKKRKLMLSSELSRLSNEYCGMFSVDKESKQLRTMTKSGCCWHQYSTFKVENDKPLAVKVIEEGQGHSPFIEIIDSNWVKGKQRNIIRREIDFDWADKEIEKWLSFTIKENQKQVILFTANKSLYYVLLKRNGKDVEFSYPETHNFVEDGQWHMNDDTSQLTFKNGDANYVIYETHNDNTLEAIGIRVKVNGKTYQLKGDITTAKGSLDSIIESNFNFDLVDWRG